MEIYYRNVGRKNPDYKVTNIISAVNEPQASVNLAVAAAEAIVEHAVISTPELLSVNITVTVGGVTACLRHGKPSEESWAVETTEASDVSW